MVLGSMRWDVVPDSDVLGAIRVVIGSGDCL